jgi:ribosomal protein S18 acetylase RimI-like enzyme
MTVVRYEEQYREEIIKLWNKVAVKDDYKEMTKQSFHDVFLNHPYFDAEGFFVLVDGAVKGFACGCVGENLVMGDKSGYLTCIVLSPEVQDKEHFLQLLNPLEAYFLKNGKIQSEVLFFNPVLLPWYIPNTPKHEHNNAPGAPLNSSYHRFLLQCGYAERAIECAMYLDLSQFVKTEYMKKKEQSSLQDGYEVELFDVSKHDGTAEMLHSLNNPLWEKEIMDCVERNVPFVVAAKENRVVGFAGPIIRQQTGRGYFAGIGVQREHEGHGLGSVLFFKLCEAFQQIGTEYMSLYTGVENPAIRIYEHAGFVPVKKFAVMRKELEHE